MLSENVQGFSKSYDPTSWQPVPPGYYNATLVFSDVDPNWTERSDGSGYYAKATWIIADGPYRGRKIRDFISTAADRNGVISAGNYVHAAGTVDDMEDETHASLQEAVQLGVVRGAVVGISIDWKAQQKGMDGTYTTLLYSARKFPRIGDSDAPNPNGVEPQEQGAKVSVNEYVKRIGKARLDAS